ncbi:lysozyme inhibitor LprI family protein [Pasteurella atlantica]|uniref:lysozyme inhibitor LprI family protein n=1 Tax=Pasteurellaceae TaxID=712 RepID=UPI003B75B97D
MYQAILSEYKADSLFIEKLKKSQRLWVKFRDAELEMKYPVSENVNPRVIYGSMYPTLSAIYLKN